MKVAVIDEHLTKLTQLNCINCYLVREEDGFTLIDTCYRGAEKFILEFTAKANVPVKRIVLTHAHVDHVGSLDAARELFPAAQLIISARERRLYEADFSVDAGESRHKIPRCWFLRCAAKIDRTVTENDSIGSLRVIATPGHTPGQIALFDSRNQALMAGDAFSSIFGLRVAGHLDWRFPFPALATWDASMAFASAEKLIRLEPMYLAAAHGPVLYQPTPMMKAALETAKLSMGHGRKPADRLRI